MASHLPLHHLQGMKQQNEHVIPPGCTLGVCNWFLLLDLKHYRNPLPPPRPPSSHTSRDGHRKHEVRDGLLGTQALTRLFLRICRSLYAKCMYSLNHTPMCCLWNTAWQVIHANVCMCNGPLWLLQACHHGQLRLVGSISAMIRVKLYTLWQRGLVKLHLWIDWLEGKFAGNHMSACETLVSMWRSCCLVSHKLHSSSWYLACSPMRWSSLHALEKDQFFSMMMFAM